MNCSFSTRYVTLSTACLLRSTALQNGKSPRYFSITPRAFPFFHPKDDPVLVSVFQLDQKNFQYFNSAERKWFEGSPDSRPVNLECMPHPLVFRFHDVIDAPGLPEASSPHATWAAIGLGHPCTPMIQRVHQL